MAYLLSLLPVLACPIMMGLMMWMLMRGDRKSETNQVHMASESQPVKDARPGMLAGLCLNWKVVAGLAGVGVGIWVVAPNLVWAALPVLILLACPLSMLFMMRGMGGGQRAIQPDQERSSVGVEHTHDEQLGALRAQLMAVTREIAELEATRSSIARDTEADAHAPHERVTERL